MKSRPKVLGLILCAALMSPMVGHAATINVLGTADEDAANGYCSLREAIISAVNDSCYNGCSCGVGNDEIKLPAGTYWLSSSLGELKIWNDPDELTIRPQSLVALASDVKIDAGLASRVFNIKDSGDVDLVRLTIRQGKVSHLTDPSITGGGLLVSGTTVSLFSCVVEDNVAEDGGGVSIGQSTLWVHDTTFRNNSAEYPDQGYYNGGAMQLGYQGIAYVTNSTFSGNTSSGDGGAIRVTSESEAWLRHTTVTDNGCGKSGGPSSDGCGIAVEPGGYLYLSNSILAGNVSLGTTASDGVDCYTAPGGAATSHGHNLVGQATGCSLSPSTGDHFGTVLNPIDPKLSSLNRNAMGTWTHIPALSSLAVDGGHPTTGNDFAMCDGGWDQRGVDRPVNGDDDVFVICDMGAVETVPIFAHDFEVGSTVGWSDEVP